MSQENGTNGHAATTGEMPIPESFRVRNHRVQEGAVDYVRLLSPQLLGVITHYMKPSILCRGKDCPASIHRTDPVWKGYVAALLFEPRNKRWYPVCLEITEHLELDMRDIYARGQEWEIWRDLPKKRGHKAPVNGKLHQELDQAALPAPFDIMPCLRSLYHTNLVDLSHDSPIPARVYAQIEDSSPPKVLQPKEAETAAPASSFTEHYKRQQKEAAQKKTTPTEQKIR